MIRKLDFVINVEKSQLKLTTKLKILGFFIDSVKMEGSLANDKKDEIVNIASERTNKSFVKIRKSSQVIGKIVIAFPEALYRLLCYRNLEANEISGLKDSKGNYESYVKVPHESKSEFNLWTQNIQFSVKPIVPPDATQVRYNDASHIRWDAWEDKRYTGENWSESERIYHINLKEMISVEFSLKCDARKSQAIRLYIGNTCAVSILKHMGTPHNKELNKKCKNI